MDAPEPQDGTAQVPEPDPGTDAQGEPVPTGSERNPEPLLDVRSAAEAAGVSDRAIRKALTAGRLEGVNLDGRWYVQSESLAAYMAEREARNRNRAATGSEASKGAGTGLVPGAMVEALAVALVAERERGDRLEAAIVELAAQVEELRNRPEPEPPRPPWWRRWFGTSSGGSGLPV